MIAYLSRVGPLATCKSTTNNVYTSVMLNQTCIPHPPSLELITALYYFTSILFIRIKRKRKMERSRRRKNVPYLDKSTLPWYFISGPQNYIIFPETPPLVVSHHSKYVVECNKYAAPMDLRLLTKELIPNIFHSLP